MFSAEPNDGQGIKSETATGNDLQHAGRNEGYAPHTCTKVRTRTENASSTLGDPLSELSVNRIGQCEVTPFTCRPHDPRMQSDGQRHEGKGLTSSKVVEKQALMGGFGTLSNSLSSYDSQGLPKTVPRCGLWLSIFARSMTSSNSGVVAPSEKLESMGHPAFIV